MKIIRILGIDPGSRITGFGILEQRKTKFFYVASGCIRTTDLEWPQRLHTIQQGLLQVIEQYKPVVVALEKIFVHKNIASALKLGQVRGVAMVSAAQQSLPVVEYTPRQVKKAVVGYGSAEKTQIQHMMQALLKLNGLPQADAADALALAFCHGQCQGGLTI